MNFFFNCLTAELRFYYYLTVMFLTICVHLLRLQTWFLIEPPNLNYFEFFIADSIKM